MQRVARIEELQIDAALWQDPFNDQQLKVIESEGVRTIYSVGRNARDDGGNVTSPDRVDLGWAVPVAQ